jgi:hypothetical protein
MVRAALLGLLLAACSQEAIPTREAPAGVARAAFTSAGAILLDFELDATLVTDTLDPIAVDKLIETQLLFTVGQLNGDSSVARLDHASYGVTGQVERSTTPPTHEIHYHARLPVAWGGGPPPTSYSFALPQSVGPDDQTTFTAKYGSTCTDPEAGAVDAGEMFLFYRPHQTGCVIDPADVAVATTTVTSSTHNSIAKYPEYHRVWEDQELDVVAMFGREFDDGRTADDGAHAYLAFVQKTRDYLRSLQPDAAQRTETTDAMTSEPNVRLAATLPDGRRIRVDVLSTRPSLRADTALDAWYDARSADADAILYNGRAGLGDNVRALMDKGEFRPRKYVIEVINGCDTFAYVDDTLATRRAALNPDDPTGTRYMDTITNVLGAYFHSGDATASTLVQALVSAAESTPKTYDEIFGVVDPTQIIVVDGEQDNQFAPGMVPPPPIAPAATPAASAADPAAPPADPTPSVAADGAPRTQTSTSAAASGKCSIDGPGRDAAPDGFAFGSVGAAVALLAAQRRRRRLVAQ